MVQTCGVSFLTGATFSGYYTPTMRSCSEWLSTSQVDCWAEMKGTLS
jgi:hypothetical protein